MHHKILAHQIMAPRIFQMSQLPRSGSWPDPLNTSQRHQKGVVPFHHTPKDDHDQPLEETRPGSLFKLSVLCAYEGYTLETSGPKWQHEDMAPRFLLASFSIEV
ncbi:hypothetical protein GJ744_005695 [Endocarpon pusillum]|uniref:Uncharacterized protein n=1 Tax=Endocarpon pusillum TaxID=364733 RepID=A0A8H7E747_9EURO|nr:hypothetical protein GJ744_005695 [Endocarpon pusillum]